MREKGLNIWREQEKWIKRDSKRNVSKYKHR